MQSKLFLVDVDGTLLDTEKLKEANRKRFAQQFGQDAASKLWEIYALVLKEKGFVDIKKIAADTALILKIEDSNLVENFFLDSPFKDYLFPGALKFLENLKNDGKVMIYSQGDNYYQALKVRKSGIEEAVGAQNVIIREDKTKYLSEFKTEVENQGFDEIVIFDNLPSFLESAGKIFPQAKLVLVKEGKYNT